MHVVVDGYGLTRPSAGIGTYTREIVSALREAQPERELTIPRQPGVRFFGRHLIYPLTVRHLRPDVFFAPAGHLPIGATGCPEVVTIHDLAIYRHPEWFPEGQTLATQIVVPRSLRRARALIAVSESTARDAVQIFGLDRERIEVVHHGVSPRFAPAPAAPDGGYVLFVGTIEPRKNLSTLLAAWEGIDHPLPLVVAGGWGWRWEEDRERLERMGDRVRVLGEVRYEDLPALYAGARCLAHPAWYEGFGMTVLEAMASGTPVIASNTSSLPEAAGDAAILVDPGDVEAWRAALQRVLGDGDLAADLRRRGLERAAEFTWRNAAARTWTVLERVLR
ncbi:MAG TPA: glycosyltransferase family 1 protein [Candidatus Dormibacteraeota bacterium]